MQQELREKISKNAAGVFQKKIPYALFFSLILTFWLWLDLISLMLSALCTYFYFGWVGTSFHLLKISLVAVTASSGAMLYKVLFRKRASRWSLKFFLSVQFLLYLLLALIRDSHFFAWTVVLGNMICGMTTIDLYRRFRAFSDHEMPFFGVLLGVVLYLTARILNEGLITLFNFQGIPAVVLGCLFISAMTFRHPGIHEPVRQEKAGSAMQWYGITFGLLIGLCIVVFYNLSLWSSKTPAVNASIYYGSFSGGTLTGLILSRRSIHRAASLRLLFAGAAAGMGFSLYTVFYLPYGFALGLVAHALGCFGATVFWYLRLRRYWYFAIQKPGSLPVADLVIGAVVFGIPLAYFLLNADPAGFMLALAVAAMIMAIIEFKHPLATENRLSTRWIVAVFLILVVPLVTAFLSLEAFDPPKPSKHDTPELTVMTTNVRYGWTDDYRYEPKKHLRWLQQKPVDIVGYQEFNKGSLYGGFMDLFQYYRSATPGTTIYGDANFGFGNGLSTRLDINDWRVVPYRSSDMIRRSFIWTLLEFYEQELEVFVTHVSHLSHPNKIRQEQVAELIEWIQRSQRPWILMGDFNAQPHEPEIVALLKVSNPIFTQEPGLLEEFSCHSLKPTKRIDYIFFSEHFEILEHEVLDNQGSSDHRPVYVRLRLVR